MKFIIPLLTLAVILPAQAAPEYYETTVFTSGDGYHTYRIPAIVRTNDGTLLAFCEARDSISDTGDIDIVLKRSTDNGLTWGALSVVQEEGTESIGNPAPVVDRTTGHIHMLFCRENDTVFHTVSTDHGLTWSARTEITANVKRPEWGWYATGPCHGVQLTRGEQAGRLVIPANHRVGVDGSDSGPFGAQVIYSDDNGATWQMTAYAEEINGTGANETTLVELNTPGSTSSIITSTHNAADVPLTITTIGTPLVTSSHTITGITGTLTDVNLTLDITHTWDSDLAITLIHPDGTRVELSSGNGDRRDNYTDTTFDDQAGTSITAGTAPFTGTFRPEGNLSDLNGKTANGVWTLEVDDQGPDDGGSLNSWSLSLTHSTPSTGTGSHVYINSRDYGTDEGNRSEAFSGDGGTSYTTPYNGNAHFVTPICQGSLARFSATDEGDAKNRIIFSSPNGSTRSNGALWISTDEANSWSQPKTLYTGPYAYSDMTKTADNHLGIIFETGDALNDYDYIKFARVNEAWLDDLPTPPPPAENPSGAFWNFEEKSAGSTADTTSGTILDLGSDNNNHHLTADAAFAYSVGDSGYTDSTALTFANNGGLSILDSETENNFDFAADDSFTVEVSFRIPDGTSNAGALVAKDLDANEPSWWLRVEEAGNLRFLVSDSSSEAIANTDTTLVNDGDWHTVAAVKDASSDKLKIYLDGSLIVDVADTTTGSHVNAQPLSIGKFNANSNSDFIGDIDFVRITPAALIPAQFVSTHTQFDADGDSIPDSFERSLTGDTSTFGAGDADGDGANDLLEFAIGTSPNDASSYPPTVASAIDSTNFTCSHLQRDLPTWLTLEYAFSTDLINWQTSVAGATITPTSEDAGDDLTRMIYTVSAPSGLPDNLFFKVTATSSQ